MMDEEYPGIVEHFRRMYPNYDDKQILNLLLSMKAYRAAEYWARQVYGLAR